MGANGCSGLCEKTPVLESFDDQFLPTQALIPCQICNVHLDETRFKQHIDHYHYCSIFENSQGIVNAKCLLCEHLSHNLDEQAQHLTKKHPFAKTTKKPQDQKAALLTAEGQKELKVELFKNKKQRVQKLQAEKDFQILSSEKDSQVEASIKGDKYIAEIQSKEYRGLEFQEPLAQGELIWFKVFKAEKDYAYYYLDVDPKERTIVCKAYLFSRQS